MASQQTNKNTSNTDKILEDFLKTAYEELKNNNDGKIQDYISKLACANPSLFSISICDTNGNIHHIGNYKHKFSIQSCSKPISYCIARSLHNSEGIHKHVGFEPSGREFNAHILKDDKIPHNPMINAGAIVIAHLIKGDKKISETIDIIDEYYKKLIGNTDYFGEITIDSSVFHSEKEKSDRNKSLAYLMNEKGHAFTKDLTDVEINELLEFYYHNCAISINTDIGSVICSTLANNGICPISNEKVFNKQIVSDCCKIMSSCGMYDRSGYFSLKVGMPAKSGVSGCIFLVVPGKMGICVYSPLTDDSGNSVRGVKFCEKLISNKILDKCKKSEMGVSSEMAVYKLLQYTSKNDLASIKQLLEVSDNIDINKADYDNRTALHIACQHGYWDIVSFLIDNNALKNICDVNGCLASDYIDNKLLNIYSHKEKIIGYFNL